MLTTVSGNSRRLLLAASLTLFALACKDPASPQPLVITPAEPLAIIPSNPTLQVPRSLQLSTRGGRGTGTVAWQSSDQAIASISAAGFVTARFPGSAAITARLGDLDSATMTLTVSAAWISIGPSPVILVLQGTQPLTAEVLDADGAVLSGVPVSWSTGDARIATVDDGAGLVTGIAPGTTTITAAGGGTTGIVAVYVNAPFGAQLEWSLIDSGGSHACGLEAPTGLAYCWGDNHAGALGAGVVDGTDFPLLVGGARSYGSLSVGYYATCGIEARTGFAFCWGSNHYGDLGDGTFETRWEPTLVASGRIRFSSISASGGLTCGVEAQTALGYCWGKGGLIGDGTLSGRSTPTLLGSGNLRFSSISTSDSHACGIEAQTDLAYCWGTSDHGKLGDGATMDRLVPTLVDGGSRRFSSIDTGDQLTCAIEAQTGLVFCWGQNNVGQVGDGTTTDRLVPTPVAGGRRFSSVGAGDLTCGIEAESGIGYCWGRNRVPTMVGGGNLRFSNMITHAYACGVEAQTGLGYCWNHTLVPTPVPPPRAQAAALARDQASALSDTLNAEPFAVDFIRENAPFADVWSPSRALESVRTDSHTPRTAGKD